MTKMIGRLLFCAVVGLPVVANAAAWTGVYYTPFHQ